jgi:hypothetical protein
MVVLSKKNHDLSFLTSEFEDLKCELFSSDELSFINCIVCWFDSQQELVDKWKPVQSIISIKFKTETKFSKWNIYLVLLCPDTLDLREKYAIENDRYSARKIVLDELGKQLTIDEVEARINVELLGSDLELRKEEPSSFLAVRLAIASIIKNVPIDVTNKSKEKRGEIVTKLIEHYRKK